MMTSKLITLALLACALFPVESRAVLGQPESSSEHVRKLVHGSRQRVTDSRDYTVNIISSEVGVVREYSDSRGMIFAVTWQGVSHPDLSQLLGEHWAQFKSQHDQPENRHPQGRRVLKMTTDTIQYEEGGRMGSVYGRAFIPAQVPEGVSVEELP